MSLSVLSNAMMNTTGVTTIQKDEKAAYGSIADVLRDSPKIRYIKKKVNESTIPQLEKTKASLQWQIWIYKLACFGCMIVALGSTAISIFAGSAGLEEHLKKVNLSFGLINLFSTSGMIALSKKVSSLNNSIVLMHRDIVRKKAYNDAIDDLGHAKCTLIPSPNVGPGYGVAAEETDVTMGSRAPVTGAYARSAQVRVERP
nr:NS3 [Letea virus]